MFFKRFFQRELSVEYIKSDLYRYTGTTSTSAFVREYVINKAFRFQVSFRLFNSNGLLKVLGAFLWLFRPRSIVIPRRTKIGMGLYIGHSGPVVVNPTAVIGNNVNLSQFVTIGSNEKHAAIIGDNVYIGPNVCVVEDVIIGSCVTIGAGSVVTKNIPDNATAVGNYCKVINYNNPGRYIQNEWKIDGGFTS